MPTALPPLPTVWEQAVERYVSIEPQHYLASFNVRVLQVLRPRWGERLRVNTSMFRLIFTRPDEHHYNDDEVEWVYAELVDAARVEMALVRRVDRKSLDRPGGEGAVAGNFARPENVLPALEALLWQLAEPESR